MAAAGQRPVVPDAGAGDAGCRLLDLPAPLLAAIVARCPEPSGLVASCRALAALGGDVELRARWLLDQRPPAHQLPYAAARCHLLRGRPIEYAFDLLEAAHAALLPGRAGQRQRRRARRCGPGVGARFGAAPRRVACESAMVMSE
jgi:hypothetical protein